jgi:CubicO group peptidase (beta-lactamase class C family)
MALALVLSGCVTMPPVQTEPTQTTFSAADEALFNKRFDDLANAGQALASYGPMEAVPGAARPVPLSNAEASERTISADALAAANQYAATTNSTALLVWRGGKLEWAKYFGETQQDTPIVSKSLAKPLGAVAIGRAIALGYITSVDQPAADFITEWKGGTKEPILIRHLLDMRSGFTAQAVSTFERTDLLNRAYLHPRHDEIIIRDMPMVHTPGTEFQYANATAQMIAPIIERATGMRYAAFLSKHVVSPLGGKGGEVWINRPGGMAHSGCCILLPSEDWMRLAVLLLQDGVWEGQRLLPVGYVSDMKTGTAQNPWYGMGVYVSSTYRERRGYSNDEFDLPKVLHSTPYLASDLFLFDGNGNQTAFIVPSADLVILRLGTSPAKPAEWDNSTLPNIVLGGIQFPNGKTLEKQPQ